MPLAALEQVSHDMVQYRFSKSFLDKIAKPTIQEIPNKKAAPEPHCG